MHLTDNRSHLPFPTIFGLLLILLYTIINLSWFTKTPEGWRYSGFLQSDQVTYTAIARGIFEGGTGITYACPYAIEEDNPPLYFQLPFTLLAWLWHFGRLSFPVAWEVFRICFGLLSCLLLYRFISVYFLAGEHSGKTAGVIFIFICALFCGGLAWPFALARWRSLGGGVPFIDALRATEAEYHWWALNFFRLPLYPLELMYHSVVFAALIFLVRRKNAAAVAMQLLAWLCNPFVGIELSLIVLACLSWQWFRQRDRKTLILVGISLTVLLAFVLYYQVILTSFPVGKSLVRQHEANLQPLIPLHRYLPAYGLWLVLVPFALLNENVRRMLFTERKGRVLLCFIGVVIVLSQNDKFLPGRGIQPPHFLRGYLFIGFCLLIFTWVQEIVRRNGKFSAKILIPLALLFIFSIPDNALFLIELATRQPHPGLLTYPAETEEVLKFLENQSGSLRILNIDPKLGDWIPARTRHRPFIAEVYSTPFWAEKQKAIAVLFRLGRNSGIIERYKIDLCIFPRVLRSHYERRLKSDTDSIVFQNRLWFIVRPGRLRPSTIRPSTK